MDRENLQDEMIYEIWTGMKPLSLRQQIGQGG
jgi:uncharacterized protein YbdZ (MbtH family)